VVPPPFARSPDRLKTQTCKSYSSSGHGYVTCRIVEGVAIESSSIGSARALEPSGTAQWYAARVAVNKELAVARRFPGAYVPTWTTRTGTAGLRPLIPGYTFFHCQPEQLFAAGHIPGVIGWLTEIGYTSRPAVIPDSEIDQLKYAVSRDSCPAELQNAFHVDQVVRIMTGPLAGHEAVVTGRGKGYVTVGYTLFNRSLSTRFDPLEVVPL
jgi:hypothetical protein